VGGVRIRDLELTPPLVLAPMEGVTDLGFRRLVRSVGGCGLTVTEFVPGAALVGRHRVAMRAVEFDPDERPVSVQLYGRDPDVLAEAARHVEGLGADLVDLNMGCPSKKVCQNSGGASLLREPELARRIVRAIRAATRLPFTVKMRSGWDPDCRTAPDVAAMCSDEGVEAVAVHWRTRADGYGGERDLSTIAAVKRRVAVPVVANGDVDETNARSTLDETGADGLMIGRAAIRDPWVFLRVGRALRGEPPLVVDDAERERVLTAYFESLRAVLPAERWLLGRIKKLARYFGGDDDDGDELRWRILHAPTTEAASEAVSSFFDERRRTGRATRTPRPPRGLPLASATATAAATD
jgi:tRNA-dihydrouridine synthase B